MATDFDFCRYFKMKIEKVASRQMRWWHFCLVCFSYSLLPSVHAQEILYCGNSCVSVLIKMQPLSLSFWNYIVFQEPFLYLSGDWSVWGLSDCNQFCQDFLSSLMGLLLSVCTELLAMFCRILPTQKCTDLAIKCQLLSALYYFSEQHLQRAYP